MSKVTTVFFSPTDNTKKSLTAMAEAFELPCEEIDLTTPGVPERAFGSDEWVIFGAPVYGGRIPAAAKPRFAKLKGNHTPCLVVATYGNRDFDDALVELADMASAQGFVVRGAAALIGRHTYGEIQMTRPDADDLAADQAFVKAVLAKEADAPVEIPGNRPYKDGGNGGKFRPSTSEECVRCGLCVSGCPVQAIDADCQTISDACIACFRCIRRCPVGAKQMVTDAYRDFATMFTQRLAARRENQFFL